jgi:phage terminase large subunit-like protein
VYTSAHSIYCSTNGGFYRALSRENGGNQDGVNTHFGLVDELHAHDKPDLVENLETSMAARAQAMLFQITTAGFNLAGVCYNTRALCVKILKEVVDAEHYFAIIFTLDEGDDWTDPAVWPKSNPNWGVSIDPKKFAAEAAEAIASSAKEGYFVTKRLNVWRNAKAAWMNMIAWAACADTRLKLEDFVGEECYVGLDLANSTDIAALVFIIIKGNRVFVIPRFYLPESEAETGEGAHYAGWALDRHLTLTPGNVTDQNLIQDDLRAAASLVQIKGLAYDPWQAKKFATEIEQEGIETIEYRNTVPNFSAPMKSVFAMVKDALTPAEKKRETNYQLVHDGNPVMSWMMSNVVGVLDAKDNIYPRKEQPKNKIDGPVALITAVGAWGGFEEEAPSIYESRGLLSF